MSAVAGGAPRWRCVAHGEVELALHELRPAPLGTAGGPRLLLVHELGASSARWIAPGGAAGLLAAWPGPVLALDLAGHGESQSRVGGAYTPELFAADVDAALAALGACFLAGAGLGAYVCLLVAGARPDLVPAALLLPGAGLDGGGPHPHVGRIADPVVEAAAAAGPRLPGGPDPLTHACAGDVRPPDYAQPFAGAARRLLLAEDGSPRPPWWRAVAGEPSARRVSADRATALAALGALAGTSGG
jgi:pimeloyl-ACP methyl ester carboxylesterase